MEGRGGEGVDVRYGVEEIGGGPLRFGCEGKFGEGEVAEGGDVVGICAFEDFDVAEDGAV